MKGIAFSYWEDGWHAADIVEKKTFYGVAYDSWQAIQPPENMESIMAAIATGVRSKTIDGFTLFYQPTRKGWQMSIRRTGEPGWDIKLVTEAEAQSIFTMIQAAGHPDGPMTLKPLASWHAPIAVDPLKGSIARNAAARDANTAIWLS